MYRQIHSLVCGNFCTLCVSDDGYLYSFGKNDCGKLGHDSNKDIIFPPERISSLHNIKMVDCGFAFTICIDYDGNIFSFGKNTYGQLGFIKQSIKKDENIIVNVIHKIENIPPIEYISCGDEFTICIDYNDNLWSFGNGMSGQLGHGLHITRSSIPLKIDSISDVSFVATGLNFVICKTNNDSYYCWGSGASGQLGNNNKKKYSIPTLCTTYAQDIISIKCGSNHTLFLTINGTVYGTGSNNNGQLGEIKSTAIPVIIPNLPEIHKISCGDNHTMFIDIDDNLWVCGSNFSGQLGIGDQKKRTIPTKIDSVKNIIDISYRGPRTFIKTIDNKIYGSGGNTKSQLGLTATTSNYLCPTQTLIDIEDIWGMKINNSRAKSARK